MGGSGGGRKNSCCFITGEGSLPASTGVERHECGEGLVEMQLERGATGREFSHPAIVVVILDRLLVWTPWSEFVRQGVLRSFKSWRNRAFLLALLPVPTTSIVRLT